MNRLNSIYFKTQSSDEASRVFSALGFRVSDSDKHPGRMAIDFGSEAIYFNKSNESQAGLQLEFETSDLVADYQEMIGNGIQVQKPQMGQENTPLWYGYGLSLGNSLLSGWNQMLSQEYLECLKNMDLPLKHPCSAFGFEGIAINIKSPQDIAKAISKCFQRPASRLNWTEVQEQDAERVLCGDKFVDLFWNEKINEGPFMLTFKTTDLESFAENSQKAGITLQASNNRDGYYFFSKELGFYLRFVRAAWKRAVLPVKSMVPFFRYADTHRPLGGAHTSTLEDGFKDRWR